MKTGQKLTISFVFSVITLACIVGFSASKGNFAPTKTYPTTENTPDHTETAKKSANLPKKEKAVAAVEPPLPKQISMADAVIIAERTAKGYVTKAERTDRPSVSFTFEIMTREGTKTHVILFGDGKVKSAQANPADSAPTNTTKSGKKGNRSTERDR